MIQDGTTVIVTDNTGGKIGKVFKVLGSSRKRYAGIGDKVVISIRVADPRKVVKKKNVEQAVVVRTVKAYRRKDGSYIRFDDNAAVIIDPKSKDPKGTRIFGPIAREIRNAGFMKIISLAPEVV